MAAYLHKARTGYTLTLVPRACNGAAFNEGEKISVKGKREARKICAEKGATPHNF